MPNPIPRSGANVSIIGTDRVHALTHRRRHVVTNLPALTLVAERVRYRHRQPHPPVDLAHQQRPAIGGNGLAKEVPLHLALAAV